MIQLIPAQESAFRVLKYASNAGSLMLLSSPSGRGRTTVLRKLHAEMGGGFVTGKDFKLMKLQLHAFLLVASPSTSGDENIEEERTMRR